MINTVHVRFITFVEVYLHSVSFVCSTVYPNAFSQYSLNGQLDSGLLDFQVNQARLFKVPA